MTTLVPLEGVPPQLRQWSEDLIAYVREITPIDSEACKVNRHTSGTQLFPQFPDSGASGTLGEPTTPYVMGSSKSGSANADLWEEPLPLDQAQTDTWVRDTPPVTVGYTGGEPDANRTDGVKIQSWVRFHISNNSSSGTFTQKVFARTEIKDAEGKTWSISAEALIETDVESGSGSYAASSGGV